MVSRHTIRILHAGIVIALLTAASLRADTATTQPATAQSAATQPAPSAGAAAHPVWREGDSLRYRIVTDEQRCTINPRQPRPGRLKLTTTLDVKLDVGPIDKEGLRLIRATFERIAITGESDGQPIRYDSQEDKQGKGNPLADLLSLIVGQRFEVRATPDGAFAEVRGLDAIWRRNNLLAAPPALVSFQLMFRDLAVEQLLADTIAPPVPAKRDALPARYTVPMPVSVPMVALLEWPATYIATGLTTIDGKPCIHVTANGVPTPAHVPGDISGAGLLCSVDKAVRKADMDLDPQSGQVIRNAIDHDLHLVLTLKPPAGGTTQTMMLKQLMTITTTRLES